MSAFDCSPVIALFAALGFISAILFLIIWIIRCIEWVHDIERCAGKADIAALDIDRIAATVRDLDEKIKRCYEHANNLHDKTIKLVMDQKKEV